MIHDQNASKIYIFPFTSGAEDATIKAKAKAFKRGKNRIFADGVFLSEYTPADLRNDRVC